MNTDTGPVNRFAAFLSSGDWETVRTESGLEVRSGPDGILDPFVPVRIDDSQVRDAIATVDSDTKNALWPGRSDEFVAFALMSVHLEEILATREGPVGQIEFREGRLRWVAEQDVVGRSVEGADGTGWSFVNPISGDQFPPRSTEV